MLQISTPFDQSSLLDSTNQQLSDNYVGGTGTYDYHICLYAYNPICTPHVTDGL